ncbi:hypothetical protein A9X03_06115 [Mycobacterium sp. E1715]|uniref:hypothetical protein n=1 Tax=Mycobacterium sp. E1715 TaxID=1856863 RepID=UPI0007FE2DC1|nr:hypothetical protein [Mycobacterium sp. E1715]OBH32548.1 hypothetical protein A9X03_06115 [Mycobacterium sp. E1715]
MTNPPPGPPPPEGWRPPDQPSPGYPYQPYPAWQPQPPQRKPSGGEVFGAAIAGMALYAGINAILGPLVLFGLANAIAPKAAFATGAVMLGLIAFGGGGALLFVKGSAWARGIGMGLMIGWALTSIFTVGICTGLNPMLYHITR